MTPAEVFLEEIKRRHRELLRGDCKVLSKGDICTCTLCLCDSVRDALEQERADNARLVNTVKMLELTEKKAIAAFEQERKRGKALLEAVKRYGFSECIDAEEGLKAAIAAYEISGECICEEG